MKPKSLDLFIFLIIVILLLLGIVGGMQTKEFFLQTIILASIIYLLARYLK